MSLRKIIILMLLLLIMPSIIQATCTGDSPPASGDWTITQLTDCSNMWINLSAGSDIVMNAGKILSLRNVSLSISGWEFADNSTWIFTNVSLNDSVTAPLTPGGKHWNFTWIWNNGTFYDADDYTFDVYNDTIRWDRIEITRFQTPFLEQRGGNVTITNSYIHHTADGTPDADIYIYNGSTRLYNNTFVAGTTASGYDSIFFITKSCYDADIRGNTWHNHSANGIWLQNGCGSGNKINITDNNFYNVHFPVYLDNKVNDTHIEGNYFDSDTTGYCINGNDNWRTEIFDNVCENSGRGLYMYRANVTYFRGNTIRNESDSTHGGLICDRCTWVEINDTYCYYNNRTCIQVSESYNIKIKNVHSVCSPIWNHNGGIEDKCHGIEAPSAHVEINGAVLNVTSDGIHAMKSFTLDYIRPINWTVNNVTINVYGNIANADGISFENSSDIRLNNIVIRYSTAGLNESKGFKLDNVTSFNVTNAYIYGNLSYGIYIYDAGGTGDKSQVWMENISIIDVPGSNLTKHIYLDDNSKLYLINSTGFNASKYTLNDAQSSIQTAEYVNVLVIGDECESNSYISFNSSLCQNYFNDLYFGPIISIGQYVTGKIPHANYTSAGRSPLCDIWTVNATVSNLMYNATFNLNETQNVTLRAKDCSLGAYPDIDTKPPFYTNISSVTPPVYYMQNVTFWAIWEDNIELSNYIFWSNISGNSSIYPFNITWTDTTVDFYDNFSDDILDTHYNIYSNIGSTISESNGILNLESISEGGQLLFIINKSLNDNSTVGFHIDTIVGGTDSYQISFFLLNDSSCEVDISQNCINKSSISSIIKGSQFPQRADAGDYIEYKFNGSLIYRVNYGDWSIGEDYSMFWSGMNQSKYASIYLDGAPYGYTVLLNISDLNISNYNHVNTSIRNVSNYTLQINYTYGSNISWKFYAQDWYGYLHGGNWNETPLQTYFVGGELLNATTINISVKAKFTDILLNYSINRSAAGQHENYSDLIMENYVFSAYFGGYNFTVNATGWYPLRLNFSLNTSNGIFYIANMTDSNLTIYAKDYATNSTLSNFTIWIHSEDYPEYIYNQTANGNNVSIGLTENLNYSISINASGYSLDTIIFQKNVSNYNYTFYLRTRNSISINIYNESTNTKLNDILITLDLIGETESYNYTLNGSETTFIGNLSSGDWRIEYQAPSYTKRTYWFSIEEQQYNPIDLFLLSEDLDTLGLWTVEDLNGKALEDVYIKVQRFYTNDNEWKQVNIGKTGSDGKAILNLEYYSVWYKFIFEYGGSVRKITSPKQKYNTEITETIQTAGNVLSTLEAVRNLEFSLYNISNTIYYTYVDSTGLVRRGCLLVTKMGISEATEICNICVESASSTITCEINETSGTYIATALIDDDIFAVDTLIKIIDAVQSQYIFGKTGLLFGLILITSLLTFFVHATVGLFVSLIAGSIALTALGWIPIPATTFISFIILIFAAIYYFASRGRT